MSSSASWATDVALAGGDRFATVVGSADVRDRDMFTDDRAGAREAGFLVEGVLESLKLLVFVVAVDGVSSIRLSSSGRVVVLGPRFGQAAGSKRSSSRAAAGF